MARLVASFRFNLTCLGAGHWPARLNPTARALQSLSTRVPALPKTDRGGSGACPDVPRIWQSVSNHAVPSPLRPASQVAQPPFYRRRRHGVCCRIHRLSDTASKAAAAVGSEGTQNSDYSPVRTGRFMELAIVDCEEPIIRNLADRGLAAMDNRNVEADIRRP